MAASKTKFLLLVVFFLLSTLFTAKASQEDSSSDVIVAGIVRSLAENGYKEMSSIVNTSLTSLISNQNSTAFTMFCPTDIAFASLRNARPPRDYLAYHVTPHYLPREDLELRTETLRMYLGIDTLLLGNFLVVTTQVPHLNSHADFQAEVNLVKIMNWNIYNDGNIIVHGVQDFLDPAAQAILFPWLQLHEITKTTIEEGYFSIAWNPFGFIAIFTLCILAVSGLIFLAFLSIYDHLIITSKGIP